MRSSFLALLLAIFGVNSLTELRGQSERTTLEVLRRQALSLSDSAVAKLVALENDSVIIVRIEGSGFRQVVENAFLNRLIAVGHRPRLAAPAGAMLPVLSVLMLDHDAVLEPLGPGDYRRTCVTRFEARFESGDRDQATYLGLFEERQVDTAKVSRSEMDALIALRIGGGGVPGFFEGFLSPALIILSTVVIVYLFFTVRS